MKLLYPVFISGGVTNTISNLNIPENPQDDIFGLKTCLTGKPLPKRSDFDDSFFVGRKNITLKNIIILFTRFSANELQMDTVPMSSVVAELNTYVFTAFASGSLAVTAVTCLLVSAFRRTDHGANGGGSWTPSSSAYDWLLATVAVALATVIRWRLAVMKRVTEQMTASTGYVNLAPACRMHAACVTCATVLTVAALLRLTKPRWPSSGRLYLAAAVTAVSIYYFFDRLSRDEVH